MNVRSALQQLNRARRLAETGQHAAVVEYLGAEAADRLAESPTLALLYGTAHARLGHYQEGERWANLALERAREQGDWAVEVRALNVRGLIALEVGRIDHAERHFMEALAAAQQESDHAMVGRCSTNLGVVANLRGDYGQALTHYTMALTAFQQVSFRWGVVATRHNIGITYRDRRELARAFAVADQAVQEAEAVGDLALAGQTLAGRAEIRALSGDAPVARREIERALAIHRGLRDVVGEAEDLRILALTQAASGELTDAEQTLREVIERAGKLARPLLAASARRDLAAVLAQRGQSAAARDEAQGARTLFHQLGAAAETRRLDEFLATERYAGVSL